MGTGKKIAVIFVILLFLSPELYSSYTLIKHRECYFVLSDILDIQDLREDGFDMAQKASGEYRSGRLNREEYKEKRASWLSSENALAGKAMVLYDRARDRECF